MTQYFDNFKIVYTQDGEFPVENATKYRRRKNPIACLQASDLADLGSVVSVRTQNGTFDIDTRQKVYYTLEKNGKLHRIDGERFHRILERTDISLPEDYCGGMGYIPA